MLSTMRQPRSGLAVASAVRAPQALTVRQFRGVSASQMRLERRSGQKTFPANCWTAPAGRRWFSEGQVETHEFKAETKKLLDIVARSLYTDKEVFIRELISNASDACEKLRFMQGASQVTNVHDEEVPLQIRVTADAAAKTFTIEDSGVGMTKEELIDHLGTIAKSGSLDFIENGEADANTIIGQFGVGFYSTFVVADKVEVFSKTCDAEKGSMGYKWTSDGTGSYELVEMPELQRGTKIVLHLKDDATEFSETGTVKKAAEKFSSFVDFPIYVNEAGEDKKVTTQEALWLKSSATEDEHKEFFRYLSGTSYGDPYYTLKYSTDAPLSIKSCFYVPDPDNAPSRMFSRDPEIGVALHSRRVLVKKHADGIIPRWLHWVRGVVDCEDMPMNVSRENMQDTRLMEKLSMAVVRRVLRFLQQQAKRDPEKYSKFFKGYSYYLKAGVIEDKEANFGRHKEDLLKLMRFESSTKDKDALISLDQYAEEAKDGQKNIYYFCVPDRNTAMSSPYMEQFISRNRSVLLMYEDIDEYVVNSVEGFKEMKFVSVDSGEKDFEWDLDAPEEEEKKADQRELTTEEQKDLEVFIKSVLKEKIQEVKFSDRLVSSPALVTSMISPHMRKMMKQLMAGREDTGMGNMPMTLELSAKHHIITTLHTIKDSNEPVARIAVEQLFDNACIAAGTLDEPRVLLSRLGKVLEMFVYQGAGFDYAKGEYNTGSASTSEPPKEKKDAKVEEVTFSADKKFEETKP